MDGGAQHDGSREGGDSLVGVRACGCITAWMDLQDASEDDALEFRYSMAATDRKVRRAQFVDICDQLGPCKHATQGDRRNEQESFDAAIYAGERAHLLTIGSPVRGLCLRGVMGRLDRRGRWHGWQPNVFFIWRGKRVGGWPSA